MSLVDWLILSTRSIVAQYQNGIQKYSLDFDTFEFSFKKMCPSLVDKSSGTRFNWSCLHNQDRNMSLDSKIQVEILRKSVFCLLTKFREFSLESSTINYLSF